MSKTPADFSRLAWSRVMVGSAREAGNFPQDTGKSRAGRHRCGRSSADTFEREPVVGAEMGGHGETRLAGPDTAILRVQGTGSVARCFRAPRILPPLILALLWSGASDSERQIGAVAGSPEKKSRWFTRKNRSDRLGRTRARAQGLECEL